MNDLFRDQLRQLMLDCDISYSEVLSQLSIMLSHDYTHRTKTKLEKDRIHRAITLITNIIDPVRIILSGEY